ncbi:hypothetical protein HDE_04461 [Halotydeus destructor]|nr:hypothetical protein HDE_04461 [Halotydeus destructor]
MDNSESHQKKDGRPAVKVDLVRRQKRIFDRKSGSDKTGIKATAKRDGSGPRNWGDLQDDLMAQLDDSYLDQQEDDD